jgi:hypothetical protein
MGRVGSIRAGFLLGAATLVASPAAAQDGGVRMVFGFEQRFDTGWNTGLDVPETGRSSFSTTRLSFGLTSQTEIDLLQFDASTAMVVENSFDTDGTEFDFGRPDLRFAYTREIPNALFNATARYREDDVDAFETDIADDSDDGTRTDYGATLRLETGRTAPLGFALGASLDVTEYQDTTDPDLTDIETLQLSLDTRLRFSEVLTGTVGLAYSRSEEEDLAQTLTETATATIGLDYAVSERLDAGFFLGLTEIETEEFGVIDRTSGPVARVRLGYDMPVGTASAELTVATDADEGRRTTFEVARALELPTGAFSARLGVTNSDDAGTDLIGGIEWSRVRPDGSYSLSLERSVSFDDDADESAVDTVLEADWVYDVNAISSVALDFSYAVSDAPSEYIEETEIGATYRHALTEDWNFDSGVRYRLRRDADGRSDSPSIFVALRRDFEFRP